MDLYRTLRVSIYLLVASGAFAITLVERNLGYLLCVLVAGAVANVTVDTGHKPPLRSSLVGALSFALLLLYGKWALLALRAGHSERAAAEMAHFLCAIQIVLFFTAFRGSALIAFCGSSLFIVVLSGILNPGASLLLRLVLYLVALTWTLYLHALWLGRKKFEQQQPSWTPSKHTRPRNAAHGWLSERGVRQGLFLTLGTSVSCLLFGLLLFFAWPRLSGEALAFIQEIFSPVRPDNTADPEDDSRLGARLLRTRGGLNETFRTGGASRTGFGEGLSLDQLGKLVEDPSDALQVSFDVPVSGVASASGRIFYRGMAYHTYTHNHWRTPRRLEERPNRTPEGFVQFNERNPNFLAPRGSKEVLRQQVHLWQMSRWYFHLAPIQRLKLPKAMLRGVGAGLVADREGGLHTANRPLMRDNPIYDYEVYSHKPVYADALPPGARTRLPNRRYLRWSSAISSSARRKEIKRREERIVAGAHSERDKAFAIRNYLRDSGLFSYTLDLDQLKRRGDNIAEFLLDPDPRQRRGHCAYFATAFVILCRAAGLPARLATGYAKTLGPAEYAEKKVTFQNKDAHAWGEVFFKDYGWVPFDATPGAPDSGGADPSGPRQADPLARKPGEARSGSLAFSRRNWMERTWSNYFLQYDRDQQERLYGAFSEKLSRAMNGAGDLLSGPSGWGTLLKALLWLLLAGLGGWLAWTFYRGQERRRGGWRNLPPRARAALTFYNDLLQVLSKKGFLRRSGQTPREFARSVVRRGGEAFAPVLEVTGIFERVRYGGEDIGQEELKRLKHAFDALREQIQKQPAGAAPAP